MLKYIDRLNNHRPSVSDEKGAVLMYCMFVLMVLTTLGILAHHSSTTETKIAVNEQRWEAEFNVTEGGTGVEATRVGYARPGSAPWYEISNPEVINQFLVPPTAPLYDPGNDIVVTGTYPGAFFAEPNRATRRTMWPHQNLRRNTSDDTYDYAYLVTYLGASPRGVKGYDAGTFAAYQFRINSARQISLELGGIKIGVKPM